MFANGLDDEELAQHLRLCCKIFVIVVVTVTAFGWFFQMDGDVTGLILAMASIIIIPVLILTILASAAVLIKAGFSIAKDLSGRPRALALWSAPISMMATIVISWNAVGWAADAKRNLLLWNNFDRFEAYAGQAGTKPKILTLANGNSAKVITDGDREFFLMMYLGDNGQGFVRDPSGEVALAKGWGDDGPGDFTAPPHIRNLFRGHLVGCKHIRGDYFYCSIT